ncbi:MAG: glycosyl hydrolase family 8 [Cytophagales bacterium]
MTTTTFKSCISMLFVMVYVLNTSAQINTPTGATVPFGTNTSYQFGLMPTNRNVQDARTAYENWKRDFTQCCDGFCFVRSSGGAASGGDVVSEGIAYGMLLSAYAADKALFDGLWNFYKSTRTCTGFMNWQVNVNGCRPGNVTGSGGAADADVDAAMALIVAARQWPNSTTPHNYRTDARQLVADLMDWQIDHVTTPRYELGNGDGWLGYNPTNCSNNRRRQGSNGCRNPSYQAPGYFQAFIDFIPEADPLWAQARNAGRNLWIGNAHPTTGLASNWCRPGGSTDGACSGSGTSTRGFGYDAIRTPWRQGVDAIWYGHTPTVNLIERQVSWWESRGGIDQIGDGYNYDGTGSRGNVNSTFISMIGAQSLGLTSSTRQTWVNNLYQRSVSTNTPGYFSQTLRVLGLFVQTGNFWNPNAVTSGGSNQAPTVSLTAPASGASFCAGTAITLSANAADADGTISKVDFFRGTTLIASVTTAPYNHNWTNAPVGTHSITAVATDNRNATTTSAARSITVNAAPNAPTVNSPVNLCVGGDSSPLSATGTALRWYTSGTGGTGSTTAPTPSTASAGTQNFWVSQTVNGCESQRAQIIVNVNQPTAPTVNSPVNYCQGSTATALTATGTSLRWYTSATGGTSSTVAPTPSTNTVGTQNFWVSQTVSACESPRAQITVNVGTATASPTVSSPVTYCQGATATPLTAQGTNLRWYTTATGGTASTTAPTPNTSTTGNTLFYASQIANGCESPRAIITVTVNQTPAAPTVSSPVIYRLNESATPLTATGTNLRWFTTAAGGTGSTTAPTPSTNTEGTVTFYVSQTNTSGCESPRAAIEVVVANILDINRTSTAPIIDGTMDAIWNGVTPQNITKVILPSVSSAADLSGSFRALWDNQFFYIIATITDDVKINDSQNVWEDDGVELFFDFGNKKLSSYAATDVQYTFRWNDNTIHVNPSGRPTSGINFSMVGTATGYVFEARIPWANYQVSPQVGQLHGFDIHLNDDDNGGARDGKMAWNSSSDDAWQNPSLLGTIRLTGLGNQAPSVSLTSPTNNSSFCSATNITLSANASDADGSVARVEFYRGTTLIGTVNNAPYNFNWTNAPVGTHSITARAFDNLNLSTTSTAINITINGIPNLPTANSPVNLCQGTTASALTATGTALRWYASATGGTANTTAPTPSTANAGTQNFWVSQTLNGCESARAQITVNVNIIPATPNPSSNNPVCIGESINLTTSQAGAGATYAWTGPNGFTSNNRQPSRPNATLNMAGQYTVRVTQNSCTSNPGNVQVVVESPVIWFEDRDGDGFGDPNSTVMACEQPMGYVSNNQDECPGNPNKSNPGLCGCDVPEGQCVTSISGNWGVQNMDELMPNPYNKVAYLKTNSNESTTVRISSVNGELISEFLMSGMTEIGEGLPSGTYFVYLQNSEGIRVKKMVKID